MYTVNLPKILGTSKPRKLKGVASQAVRKKRSRKEEELSFVKSFQYVCVMVLGLIVAIVPTSPAAPQSPGSEAVFDENDPLVQDARWYAEDQGIELSEAVRRLKLQEISGDLNADLEANEKDTFAGMWTQHESEYRIIVRFTRDGSETIQRYIEGSPLEGIVELRPADTTYEELERIQARALYIVDGLDIRAESVIDVKSNRVELWVSDPTRLANVLQTTNARLPDEVDVVKVEGFSSPTANIYAGQEIVTYNSAGQGMICTTGFSVYNQTGTRGVTTAGHCLNNAYRNNVSLRFIDQRYGGSYEVQWHTAPDFTVKPRAADEYNNNGDTTPFYRVITGTRGRANQKVDDYVCKHGRTTQTTCGYIDYKSFRPNYGDGVQFNATFILVRPTSEDMGNRGDSGGPVYVGGTALGIVSGETGSNCNPPNNCPYLIYMPIDYVSGIGVQVLKAN